MISRRDLLFGVSLMPLVDIFRIPDLRRSRKLQSSARRDYCFMTGQSLADGIEGDDDVNQISTTQPYQNQQSNVSGALSALVNTTREKPHVPACNTGTFLSPSQTWQLICRNVSGTGLPYSALKKNGTTTVYNQLINTVTNLHNALLGQGGIRVVSFMVVHGENDEAEPPGGEDTTEAEYESYLKEWRSDFETDIQAITGQTERVLLFTDQQSSWTVGSTGTATPEVAPAQWKVTTRREARNLIFCTGPKYQYPYPSNSTKHLTAQGYRMCGQKFGQAMKKVLIDGQLWYPLHPGGVTISGNDIIVSFRVPAPPIVFDTTLVNTKANMGFEYYDPNAGGPTIQSVSIIDEPNTATNYRVRVTLSSAARAGSRVRYAYTGTVGSGCGTGFTAGNAGSPRGNLRDSDTTASLYSLSMYNWCVHFDEPTGV